MTNERCIKWAREQKVRIEGYLERCQKSMATSAYQFLQNADDAFKESARLEVLTIIEPALLEEDPDKVISRLMDALVRKSCLNTSSSQTANLMRKYEVRALGWVIEKLQWESL